MTLRWGQQSRRTVITSTYPGSTAWPQRKAPAALPQEGRSVLESRSNGENFSSPIFSRSCPVCHGCCRKGNDSAAMTQAVWHCRQIGLQVDYQTGWSRSKSNMLFVTPLVCTDLHDGVGTQAEVFRHFMVLFLPVSAITTEQWAQAAHTTDVPLHWTVDLLQQYFMNDCFIARLTVAARQGAVFSGSCSMLGTFVKGKLTSQKVFSLRHQTARLLSLGAGVAPKAVRRGGRRVDRRRGGQSQHLCSSYSFAFVEGEEEERVSMLVKTLK